jgi:SAM-dependent methyltransferase
LALERARTFDGVAEAYDAHRSGYPSELFSDLIAIAKLKPESRVLEVGCGSGQATIGFVASGLDVTGVDPGWSLIELARSKFVGSAAARFEVASFEEWGRDGRQYELVAAAQSWHWVRAQTGFAKAADCLSPNGFIAIFGHTPAWSATLIDCLGPSYYRLAPELSGPPPEAWYLSRGPIPELIRASGRFGRTEHREYKWRRSYSAASFVAYLGTRSDHLLLPPARRAELLSNVESGLPASVDADWITNLYVAPLA